MVDWDVRQIGRRSSSLLFALSSKRRTGRDVKPQLYSTQGVGVKSIRLSNLCVQSLLDSVTECDAKFVTQLGEYCNDAPMPFRKGHACLERTFESPQEKSILVLVILVRWSSDCFQGLRIGPADEEQVRVKNIHDKRSEHTYQAASCGKTRVG